MPRRKRDEGSVMVWKDETGTYKLGYSQYLQQEMLKTDRLLLAAVILLLALLVVGGVYAYTLVQKIDALNVINRMALQAIIFA